MEESHKEAQMIICRGLEKETNFVSSHLVLKKNNNGRSFSFGKSTPCSLPIYLANPC